MLLDGETDDEYAARVAVAIRRRCGIRSARPPELSSPAPSLEMLRALGAGDSRSIYFAECMVDRGPIKIGLASDVGRRLGEVQVGCPYPIELMGTLPGGRAGEVVLHRLFAAFKIHGEWFWPDAIVLRTIRSLLREQKKAKAA
jgi:hypothetical protein